MKFSNAPVVINDDIRHGLVVIAENGTPEAFCDIGKGCPLANVAQNIAYLRNQRHRPKIVVECNTATARRLVPPTPETPASEAQHG